MVLFFQVIVNKWWNTNAFDHSWILGCGWKIKKIIMLYMQNLSEFIMPIRIVFSVFYCQFWALWSSYLVFWTIYLYLSVYFAKPMFFNIMSPVLIFVTLNFAVPSLDKFSSVEDEIFPGELILKGGSIVLNEGRRALRIRVINKADRPVQECFMFSVLFHFILQKLKFLR